MSAAIWMLAMLGVTHTLTDSVLLQFPRMFIATLLVMAKVPRLAAALYCRSCVGFWVGALFGALDWLPQNDASLWQRILIAGFVSTAIGTLANTVIPSTAYEIESKLWNN